VIFLPNSGLGTCATALWSLCCAYELPVLLIVSLWDRPMRDLPEGHGWEALGAKLLDALGVPAIGLAPGEIAAQVAEAAALMASSRRPVALTVKAGVLS
jgi:sulfopyruvate decarboxylase TPP-binding subunit